MLRTPKWLPICYKGLVPYNGPWDPVSQLLSEPSLLQWYWLPWSSSLCQAEGGNLGAFDWLFPPSGLLFSQIILTSHFRSLFRYPLVTKTCSDNHFYDCPLRCPYLTTFFPHFLFLDLSLNSLCVCVECNCFTMLCSFLLYDKVNQLYVYIYPLPPELPFHTSHPSRSTQSTKLRFLRYTEASHQLSILHMVVYIY